MKYRLSDKNGDIFAGTLDHICEACLREATAKTSTECRKCSDSGSMRRFGFVNNDHASAFICSKDEDDLKSSRVFRAKAQTFLAASKYIDDARNRISSSLNDRTRRLIHNLTSLNAHSIQEIYDFIPQDVLARDLNHQLKYIQDVLKHNLVAASKLYLRMAKNNLAMKIEFAVFRSLYEHKLPIFARQQHFVHKVVSNVLHTFFSDFTDHDVFVDIHPCPIKTAVDYETFSVAIFHIVENAAKYIMPHSTLDVLFEVHDGNLHIVFSMMSFPIPDNEVNRICEEGFSGETCRKLSLSGDGFGMFRTQKLLLLNECEIIIDNNFSPAEATTLSGFRYERNRFTIIMKHGGIRNRIKSWSK